MEYGRVTPHPLFSSRLRHTHQVSTYFAGGHLMTLSTSRQEGITGRLPKTLDKRSAFLNGVP